MPNWTSKLYFYNFTPNAQVGQVDLLVELSRKAAESIFQTTSWIMRFEYVYSVYLQNIIRN